MLSKCMDGGSKPSNGLSKPWNGVGKQLSGLPESVSAGLWRSDDAPLAGTNRPHDDDVYVA
jgi:hypothetical protein